MKIKYIVLLIFFLGGFLSSSAQYENTSGNKKPKQQQEKKQPLQKEKRWFGGGMIGAGFSSYSAYVEISPLVGFKVTRNFQVGTRITYIFNSYKDPYTNFRYSLNHYGGSLFGRYIIWKGLYAHVEYEALSFEYYDSQRDWINSLFLGGGFMQDIGGAGFMSFAILWNVLDNEYSPYSNPIFRIGFGIGF